MINILYPALFLVGMFLAGHPEYTTGEARASHHHIQETHRQ